MDSNTTPITITLTYDREGTKTLSPPRRVQITVTPTLAGALSRAAALNRSDSTPLTFASLLVGLVTGSDDFSAWLDSHLQSQGVTPQRIASRGSLTLDDARIDPRGFDARRGGCVDIGPSRDRGGAIDCGGPGRLKSPSTAGIWAAAYPVLPDWHVEDFEEFGIDRLAWCRALGATWRRRSRRNGSTGAATPIARHRSR